MEWTREALVAACEAYEGLTPSDINPCDEMRAALDAAVKAQGLNFTTDETVLAIQKAHATGRAEALEEAAKLLLEQCHDDMTREEEAAAIRAIK